MDLSKLPRLSQTPSPGTSSAAAPEPAAVQPTRVNPAPGAAPALFCVCGAPMTGAATCPHCGATPGEATGEAVEPLPSFLFETAMGVGVGAFMLFVTPRFFVYFSGSPKSASFPRPPYCPSPYFLADLGVVVFGAAMIIDGLLLLVANRRWAMPIAMSFSLIATLLNAWVTHSVMTTPNFGLPPYNGLAIVFSAFMLFYQASIMRAVWRR